MSGTCLVARWAEAEEEPVGHVRGPDLVLAPALVPHRHHTAPRPPRQARGHPVLARHHCCWDHCVQISTGYTRYLPRYLPRYLHQLSTEYLHLLWRPSPAAADCHLISTCAVSSLSVLRIPARPAHYKQYLAPRQRHLSLDTF